MARVENRHEDLAAAAQGMISATRKVEELLEPQLQQQLEIVNANADALSVNSDIVNSESPVFTNNTKSSHPAAALAGSATAVTWSQGQVEAMSQGQADALDLLEQSAGGAMEAERHQLEHSLLELQDRHRGQNHPNIAATLHELGQLSVLAADLPSAKQHLEESLRMYRSLYGDRGHPKISTTLDGLGQLSLQAGDLPAAKQQWEESLRVYRSMYENKDPLKIVAKLHKLGRLSLQAGDMPAALQHLDQSWRMIRAVHGGAFRPRLQRLEIYFRLSRFWSSPCA